MGKEWIDLAQNREGVGGFGNTVLKLRVHKMWGNA
jgi:hypothetical protein